MPSDRPIFLCPIFHPIKLIIGAGGNHSANFKFQVKIMIIVGFDNKNSKFVLFLCISGGPGLNRMVAMATTKSLSVICYFEIYLTPVYEKSLSLKVMAFVVLESGLRHLIGITQNPSPKVLVGLRVISQNNLGSIQTTSFAEFKDTTFI